ncbi:DNA-binding protein [Pseudomonas aeruginosa]|uniref:DNA-binding protein n=1 Tax=Pseudomonas aeruginosa TaxID=287 RepID=UPI001EDD6F91|nr:DNA-binding protein [Pseudomonas aeruginosa]
MHLRTHTDEIFVIDSNINDEYFVWQIFRQTFIELFGMIEERLRTLVRHIGAARLAEASAIKNRRRWQTVATDLKVKTRIEDLEELLKAFPQYELWLWKGEVDPARGQVAPGYEEADAKLAKPSAG